MSKHILDHAESKSEGTRVSEFARIDRETGNAGRGEASKTLHKRAHDYDHSERRTEEYLKIERGETS